MPIILKSISINHMLEFEGDEFFTSSIDNKLLYMGILTSLQICL